MKTQNLLDQLLRSGKDLLQSQTSGNQPGKGKSSSPLDGLLGNLGAGALGGGVVNLLMGNRKPRKIGGKVITYGGLAALGVVAYKAYSNWQSQQQAQQPGGSWDPSQLRTVDRVPPAQIEDHAQAILRALIGAAKADGHIDDRERELIDGEIDKLGQDQQLTRWFDQELRKPLDPSDIAQAATSPEIAAEMYLGSLLMVDEQNYMERAYLDELARQLKLDPGLRAELDAQASEAHG